MFRALARNLRDDPGAHEPQLPVGRPVHIGSPPSHPASDVAVGTAVAFGGSPAAPPRASAATVPAAAPAFDELDDLDAGGDSDDAGGLFYLPEAFAGGDGDGTDTSEAVTDDVPVGRLVSTPAPAPAPAAPISHVPAPRAVPTAPPAVTKPLRPARARHVPSIQADVRVSVTGGGAGTSGHRGTASSTGRVQPPRRKAPSPPAPVPPPRRHVAPAPAPAPSSDVTPPTGGGSVAAGGEGDSAHPGETADGGASSGVMDDGAEDAEEAARAAAAAVAARDAHDMNVALNHMGEELYSEMLEPVRAPVCACAVSAAVA